MTTPENSAGRFVRDLAVNVGGNLVTAALLYMFAVASGLVKSSPQWLWLNSETATYIVVGLVSLFSVITGLHYLLTEKRDQPPRWKDEV